MTTMSPSLKPIDHGLLVAAGYYLFHVARYLSITFWWSRLGERIGSPCIFDGTTKKTTPVWQDVIAILLLILTLFLALFSITPLSRLALAIAAFVVLLDMFIYYVNVVWFDDLRPGRDRRVWSFRRIVLQAVLSFGESIVLFAVLYNVVTGLKIGFLGSLFCSFVTATTLNLPESFPKGAASPRLAYVLWSSQVLVSLFFLVIVIAILAELGLTRKEIAGTMNAEDKGEIVPEATNEKGT